MLKAELVQAAQKHCDSSFVDVNTTFGISRNIFNKRLFF
jgi:hypothetical protein